MLSPQTPSTGLIYTPATDEHDPLTHAHPGLEIRNPSRKGPWIIVSHDVTSVTVSGWPGKLWAVEIIDRADAIDQPRSSAGYTRAVGIRVVGEQPVPRLFGPHGEAVCTIIEAAGSLTTEQATALSQTRHPGAGRAYDRAFRAWLGGQGLPIESWEDDFDGTLDARRGEANGASPILSGLKVVHKVVAKRAASMLGEAAFITNEDENNWLVQPWLGASTALCDAALGFGRPELVSDAERQMLIYAWAALRA